MSIEFKRVTACSASGLAPKFNNIKCVLKTMGHNNNNNRLVVVEVFFPPSIPNSFLNTIMIDSADLLTDLSNILLCFVGGYGGSSSSGGGGGGGNDMITQEDTIFVAGMDPSTTEQDIETHFGAIGIIKVNLGTLTNDFEYIRPWTIRTVQKQQTRVVLVNVWCSHLICPLALIVSEIKAFILTDWRCKCRLCHLPCVFFSLCRKTSAL